MAIASIMCIEDSKSPQKKVNASTLLKTCENHCSCSGMIEYMHGIWGITFYTFKNMHSQATTYAWQVIRRGQKSLLATKDLKSIRIYHECGGRIEKSFPRIAVWHHKLKIVNDDKR